MSTKDKLVERLKSVPTDFTYEEAASLAVKFGYVELQKGKTSGSRVVFFRIADGRKIMLHKPHPQNVLKKYAVMDLLKHFEENGDIS